MTNKTYSNLDMCNIFNDAVDCLIKDAGNLYYKGHTGANALSMYVYEKHGINCGSSSQADNILCLTMLEQSGLDEIEIGWH